MTRDPAERVRTLLLRADNQLKAGRPERAREALEQAREIAREPGFDPRVAELVERRLDNLGGGG